MDNGHNDIIRQSAESQLASARSSFIDAFANVEAEIAALLCAGGQLKSTTPFQTRMDAFRKLEGISKIAKANHSLRDKLADDIIDMCRLRGDIVHSSMETCQIDGAICAKFINVHSRQESCPPCRLITLADFQKVTQKLRVILAGLKNLSKVNPASSPQPPSKAAATGP